MALLETPEVNTGWQAADFTLPATDGRRYSLSEIAKGKGFVVAFICNHCPYVKAVIDRMVEDAKTLQAEGLGFVAISSNDPVAYPQDNFDNMKLFAAEHNFRFPYLFDENQSVARTYGAVCTPDFFGFGGDGKLKYRGRLDSARNAPANDSTARNLLQAMRPIAATGIAPAEQHPSMGCNIKWKE